MADFPDLNPNPTLHALSCSTPLFAFPHLPQNDIPSKLRMALDLPAHLSSSNTDRVNHALSVSANSPIWQSACNPLAHGMGHGTRRAQQFDECSNSLAPRDFFRRVSPGCGGAVGPASPQPPPQEVNVSLIPRSASLLLGRSQPFTVVVRCCLKTCVCCDPICPWYKKEPGPDRAGFSIQDGVHGSLLGGRVDPRNAEGGNWLRNGGVSGGCGHTRRGKKRRCEPIRESLIEPDISRTHVSYFGLVGNAAADD